jgi:hypothetical protein
MGRREKRMKRRERREGGPRGEWAERPAVAAVLKKKRGRWDLGWARKEKERREREIWRGTFELFF